MKHGKGGKLSVNHYTKRPDKSKASFHRGLPCGNPGKGAQKLRKTKGANTKGNV